MTETPNGIITIEAIGKPEGKDQQKLSFNYDFGPNLSSAIAKFGEAVVFQKFLTGAKGTVKSKASNHLAAGKTPEETRTIINSYVLQLGRTKKSVVDKILEAIAAIEDPEERKAAVGKIAAGLKQ